MYVNKIEIEHYRAIKKAEFIIDPDRTIIVGKNNVGKTSVFEFLKYALANEGNIEFDDYPLCERKNLYELFSIYIDNKIDYNALVNRLTLPEIKIFIDYSEDEVNADLEALKPAIIDLNEDISYAIISTTLILCSEESLKDKTKTLNVSFKDINEKKENGKLSEDDSIIEKRNCVKEFLSNNFKTLFHSKNFAINPTTLKKRVLDVKPSEIIQTKFIEAQRPIETTEGSIFNKVLQRFLKTSEPTEIIDTFHNDVSTQKKQVEEVFNKHLKEILNEIYLSKYPKESTETEIDVNMDFDFEQLILDSSSICYRDPLVGEKLPQKYNGLGYKNLLLMELEIASFAHEVRKKSPNSPCLLFIEEPESHMHPQLQERFIQFVNEFAKKLSGLDNVRPCPIVLSTHSPHIVNVVDFSKIRYFVRDTNGAVCKNLSDFAFDFSDESERKTHLDFLEKYLELTKCDLFFADKVILVEGATERIYIPYVIKKLAKEDHNFKLDHEYYTILEIGGAYGYLFIPFVRFLNTPTLIITDIDSLNDDGKSCLVSQGTRTSNATIKHWFTEELKAKSPSLKEVIDLSERDKTCGIVSISYQVEENGFIGRTLEPAIRIANKDSFLIENEQDLDINVNKVDFVLDIVSSNRKHNTPFYIKNGLYWLNKY